MKSQILFFAAAFLTFSFSFSQKDTIDVSFLPKANAVQKDTLFDRWGDVGNIVLVGYRHTDQDEPDFGTSLVEAYISKERPVYIAFPPGGTETDIYLYAIRAYTATYSAVDTICLKKKIFMWGNSLREKVLQINDLAPGFYYVNYLSCNYGGSYILWIRESTTPKLPGSF